MVGRSARTRRTRVERVRQDVGLLGVLDRGGRIQDPLDVGRLPVRRKTCLLEVVLAVIEPAHVEAVRDRPDAALVGHAAPDGVRILAPVGPLADVVVERLDVARVGKLADRAAADMEHVGARAAVERQEQLRVVVVIPDLLEVDLHIDARVLRLEGGGGLLDVLRLEPRFVGIRDVDRARDGGRAWSRATAPAGRASAGGATGAPRDRGPDRGRRARGRDRAESRQLEKPPSRKDLPDDVVHGNLLHVAGVDPHEVDLDRRPASGSADRPDRRSGRQRVILEPPASSSRAPSRRSSRPGTPCAPGPSAGDPEQRASGPRRRSPRRAPRRAADRRNRPR